MVLGSLLNILAVRVYCVDGSCGKVIVLFDRFFSFGSFYFKDW